MKEGSNWLDYAFNLPVSDQESNENSKSKSRLPTENDSPLTQARKKSFDIAALPHPNGKDDNGDSEIRITDLLLEGKAGPSGMICHDDTHDADLITVGDVKKGKSKQSIKTKGRRNSKRPVDSQPRPKSEISHLAWPRLESSTEEIVDLKLRISSVDASIELNSKGELSPIKVSENTGQLEKPIEDIVLKNTTPNLNPKIIEVGSTLVVGNSPEDHLQYNANFIKNKSTQWNATTRTSDISRFSKFNDAKSIGTLCPT
jgi:hypothetical protein